MSPSLRLFLSRVILNACVSVLAISPLGAAAATSNPRPVGQPLVLQALTRQPDKQLSGDEREESFALGPTRSPKVIVHGGDSAGTLTVTVPGQARHPAWSLQGLEAQFLQGVWTGRINQDDRPDFVVVLSAHGNGLNAQLSTVVFLLSEGGGYRATYLDAYDFNEAHLVSLSMDQPAQWRQTEFASAKGRDGKTHSFWVERRWLIAGARLTLMPTVPARWVQYTTKPSQRETSLLTPEQKIVLEAEMPQRMAELKPLP